MAAPEKLAALRHLLAERFPSQYRVAGPGRVLPTGIARIDEVVGGLPLSAVTEVVGAAPSCGSELLLGELLALTRATRTRVALIDSTDAFDPASFANDLLAHVLWVRVRASVVEMARGRTRPNSAAASGPSSAAAAHAATPTAIALQAADLLARDANLGLVVIDLRRALDSELRRTPATQWYRLQRAVESTDLALVVLTPRAVVASAQLRLVLETSHSMSALQHERRVTACDLPVTLQRQRLQNERVG